MNTNHNYKKLSIYSRGLEHAAKIIERIDTIRPYRLGEQIAASCVSIPSNIAEGSQRLSEKEFIRYLTFSSGSAAELETQLNIVLLAKKYEELPLEEWIKETEEINAMIRALIRKLLSKKTSTK